MDRFGFRAEVKPGCTTKPMTYDERKGRRESEARVAKAVTGSKQRPWRTRMDWA